jgi:hypothetical protein
MKLKVRDIFLLVVAFVIVVLGVGFGVTRLSPADNEVATSTDDVLMASSTEVVATTSEAVAE